MMPLVRDASYTLAAGSATECARESGWTRARATAAA